MLTRFPLSNFKVMSWLSSIIQMLPIRFFVLNYHYELMDWNRLDVFQSTTGIIHTDALKVPKGSALSIACQVSLILHEISPVPLL